MRVLAFDTATATAWASFASAKAKPLTGTINLPVGPNYGARNLELLKQTRRLIVEHEPDVMAFEAPHFKPRDTWHTRRLLTGLVNMIELAATLHGVRCVEIQGNDAKACLTGDRRAKKPAMVAAARLMGWEVANDDEADACAVGATTYGYLSRV